MMGGLIFFWRRERKKKQLPVLKEHPFFSVLVPCHNEEAQLEETLSYLIDLDYPNYEIIFIDDGSIDRSVEIIHDFCLKHDKVRAVYLKDNQGKAAALNAGCLVSKGELLLSMDADSLIDRQCLKWMAWHFMEYPRVGAVTGNPRVINRTTLLGKIQTGEYATIIGMIKRSQRILGKVLTVSGVIAAFRKKALLSAGFWDTDMATEDIDITWKLEKKYWDVRYEPRAVCWIFVPETLRGLWRQRLRWAQGGVEVLIKHKDVWEDWKQRRLWPIYVEYVFSALWAYSFFILFSLWGVKALFGVYIPLPLVSPMPPLWTGSILALVCLILFSVSMYIDNLYDRKLFRYLFWVIWYPFIYWMINVFTIVVAVPKAVFRKKGKRAIWTSPDRGIGKG